MIQRVTVGLNSCGIANGAQELFDYLSKVFDDKKIDIPLVETGCVGMCYREPLVDVVNENTIFTYGDVTLTKLERIIEEHIVNGKEISDWIVKRDSFHDNMFLIENRQTWDIDDFYKKQKKIVLKNSGYIDVESIEEYIKSGGYNALKKVLKTQQDDVIDSMLKSGLRGRGGAGFPLGLKWKFSRKAKGDKKFFICNADEGDPGAFMDRNVMEGDPHSVIEGMIIGGYCIGCSTGIVYIRAEYPLAIARLKNALKLAKKNGFLGENILDSGFSYEIIIKEGAGAFVCGEETAMIESIQGGRGMPRIKPPFPSEKGIWGHSTNINNVETLANVAWIVNKGWEEFAKIGLGKSKGTKVFALAGKIKRGGNVEVPMGIKLSEILYDIGGGTKSGAKIKAAQLGGPSGGCIPASLFDLNVTYEDITKTGAIVGSGGMVIMSTATCMVDISKFFLDFTVKESCGKCTYCRLGTKRMYEILERISEGNGKMEDLQTLGELALNVKNGSLCGLGQTAPNPVLTTLKYFKEEFIEHIKNHKCAAGVCKPLLTYTITDECIGCGICARKCPVNAITGEKKEKHFIDQDKCIKCGSCYNNCNFNAILKE